MANPVVLHKILSVREQEKKTAQMEQITAQNYFEKVATQLYHVLKTKEEAEQTLQSYMKTKAAIERIKEQSLYIDSLNKNIMKLQDQVQKARQEMEQKQQILTEAHIEMKKIEKMIERRAKEQKEQEEKLQMNLMDEISIQQFTAKNR